MISYNRLKWNMQQLHDNTVTLRTFIASSALHRAIWEQINIPVRDDKQLLRYIQDILQVLMKYS